MIQNFACSKRTIRIYKIRKNYRDNNSSRHTIDERLIVKSIKISENKTQQKEFSGRK